MSRISKDRLVSSSYKGAPFFNANSDVQEFEIVGKKIDLVDRKRKKQVKSIDASLCSDIDMEIWRFKATQQENMQLRKLRSLGTTQEFDAQAFGEGLYKGEQLVNAGGEYSLEGAGENSGTRQTSKGLESPEKRSLLSKKSPQIRISLPSAHIRNPGDQTGDLDEDGLFKEKTYMVCQQSSSKEANWRTTCVNFPKDTWMLERRRLSHRHSSLGSTVSLSFARLDLACKTPDQSLMSTPINGGYFVFPQNKDN
ncbi:uncharacterized protein LOC135691920 [Rhopilema esculentum]|uniref:uncharacterized protein LOC135691920 n=1 Tax=Rhopilema esculentum TaxID=499914 RepID=UPI0031D20CFC|eukprot:gene9620-17379_t